MNFLFGAFSLSVGFGAFKDMIWLLPSRDGAINMRLGKKTLTQRTVFVLNV